MKNQEFITLLAREFPPSFLTTEPERLEAYGRDWTRVHQPAPLAVAFPSSTDEAARLLKLCHEHHVAVVPSGGRTGLAGGAVAAQGELVVSLDRLNMLGPVDLAGRTVRVGAGAVTQKVHEHCAPHGLTWPVDFASKGSSQVGGNLATNAGGVRVVRYGSARAWALGLTVVTADGQKLELGGALEKNNTGLDLRQLFIGSEGTLGLITEATLKLAPLPGPSDVFFLAVESVAAALTLFRETRLQPFTLNAFELIGAPCLRSVIQHRGLRSPFANEHPYSVLLEIERPSADDARAGLETWLASLFERNLVQDGTLASGPTQARELWALREGVSESLSARGLVHKHDVSFPVAGLEAFVGDFERAYAGREAFVFGHVGDGNLHVNALQKPGESRDEFLADARRMDEILYPLIRAHGGSVSAEHGIGLLKKKALPYSRSPEELALLRAVKKALDPNGILNPGKIFDL